LRHLEVLRGDFEHLHDGARDGKFTSIVRRLEDMLVEYESVSNNLLQVVEALSLCEGIEDNRRLLLTKIYDDIVRDKTAFSRRRRGAALDASGASTLKVPDYNERSGPCLLKSSDI
jgi:hypothetical protein